MDDIEQCGEFLLGSFEDKSCTPRTVGGTWRNWTIRSIQKLSLLWTVFALIFLISVSLRIWKSLVSLSHTLPIHWCVQVHLEEVNSKAENRKVFEYSLSFSLNDKALLFWSCEQLSVACCTQLKQISISLGFIGLMYLWGMHSRTDRWKNTFLQRNP